MSCMVEFVLVEMVKFWLKWFNLYCRVVVVKMVEFTLYSVTGQVLVEMVKFWLKWANLFCRVVLVAYWLKWSNSYCRVVLVKMVEFIL